MCIRVQIIVAPLELLDYLGLFLRQLSVRDARVREPEHLAVLTITQPQQ